ncbi:hypothetical protein C3B54_111295 [Pontimonas salivibrio]|uniref:Uncharacterized protein n=1 Tax=Pontimonas salivibrio TaxID=1159327 RepID=A0A2L2BRE0_9MICO|nr:hypothetical protein [Pontimonas salivibrio]AVG24243.1 hypothetical protein C3B54_111295 [Pontimonas salivibrio]
MALNTGTKALWAIGSVFFGLGLFVWLWARGRVDSLGFANELSLEFGLGGDGEYLDALNLLAISGIVMDFGAFVLLVALAVSAIGEFVLRAGRVNEKDEQ